MGKVRHNDTALMYKNGDRLDFIVLLVVQSTLFNPLMVNLFPKL